MFFWFYIGCVGLIIIFPLYYSSLEHQRHDQKYGKQKGEIITATYGIISGWTFFIFWMMLWVSPQPRFCLQLFKRPLIISLFNMSIPIAHLFISIPCIVTAVWLGISGVRETGLKVSETHRAEKIITTGLYSIIRHPQYMAGLVAHVGITFLLSAQYSLYIFPLMVVYVYLLAKKEERELISEFGDIYIDYQKKVPMFVPRRFFRKTFFK